MNADRTSSAAQSHGPARFLILATIVLPGDEPISPAQVAAMAVQAFREGGAYVVRCDAEPIEEPSRV